MGGVILTVSYNRARIILYGDMVRALTATSVSFAVVSLFTRTQRESLQGWKEFHTPCAGVTLELSELSSGLFLPRFPYLQNARNDGAQ